MKEAIRIQNTIIPLCAIREISFYIIHASIKELGLKICIKYNLPSIDDSIFLLEGIFNNCSTEEAKLIAEKIMRDIVKLTIFHSCFDYGTE